MPDSSKRLRATFSAAVSPRGVTRPTPVIATRCMCFQRFYNNGAVSSRGQGIKGCLTVWGISDGNRSVTVAAVTVALIRVQVGIPLTQPDVSSEVVWGGRPRPRGGPCLRVRQRDAKRPARSRGTAPQSRSQRQRLSERDTQTGAFRKPAAVPEQKRLRTWRSLDRRVFGQTCS